MHLVEGGIRTHDGPKSHNGYYYPGQLLKAERIAIYPRYVFSAERVGILSAAYKIPGAAEVAFSAGLNKSGCRSVKVQGICG